MHDDHHRHSLHCILPPHILERLAQSDDPRHRELALATLSYDTSVRTRRISEQLVQALSVSAAPSVTPHKQRAIYTANHTQTLPGTLVRSEGQGASGDAATDEAYDGLGATFDLYWNVYQRNSIDNAGMNLVGTVHFGS